jgi:hypothetical protein
VEDINFGVKIHSLALENKSMSHSMNTRNLEAVQSKKKSAKVPSESAVSFIKESLDN